MADKIIRERWSNDHLALAIRLLGYLNARWARDGLTPSESCQALIGPAMLAELAGCQSLVRARSILSGLAARSSLTFDAFGADTRVVWAKYAEYQGLTARELPESRPGISPSASAPASRPRKTHTQEEKKEPTRAVARRSRAPDTLEPDQQEALKAWCSAKHPDHLATLPALIEACLDHHRAKGTTHADWVATCRTWVRRQQDFAPSRVSGVRVGRDDGLRAILHPRTASGLPSKLEEWEQEARNGTLRRIDPSAAIAQLAARVRPPDN